MSPLAKQDFVFAETQVSLCRHYLPTPNKCLTQKNCSLVNRREKHTHEHANGGFRSAANILSRNEIKRGFLAEICKFTFSGTMVIFDQN
jgi:hypothetical protein